MLFGRGDFQLPFRCVAQPGAEVRQDCSPVRPLAQMMKILPKRRSYSSLARASSALGRSPRLPMPDAAPRLTIHLIRPRGRGVRAFTNARVTANASSPIGGTGRRPCARPQPLTGDSGSRTDARAPWHHPLAKRRSRSAVPRRLSIGQGVQSVQRHQAPTTSRSSGAGRFHRRDNCRASHASQGCARRPRTRRASGRKRCPRQDGRQVASSAGAAVP